jgi:hypothetical protein
MGLSTGRRLLFRSKQFNETFAVALSGHEIAARTNNLLVGRAAFETARGCTPMSA